ncbi:MAG: sulfur carrier protein ThiS [Magnetococcales bacterium]|nr:sulfur carrier protein ThiS [Magnetococcales bacterium]
MQITLNGESTEVPENTTISQLLDRLQFTHDRVAVELNLEVAPRESYNAVELCEGDKVEVVHFIGGGAV